jgi:bacterioferritin-associated ferredoxin
MYVCNCNGIKHSQLIKDKKKALKGVKLKCKKCAQDLKEYK